jgi:hypothetical protein
VDGPFRDPEIPDGETSVYRGSIRGALSGHGTMRVEAAPDAYVQRLEMHIRDARARRGAGRPVRLLAGAGAA